MRQNEPGALFIGQAIFDQRQIQILVAAVKFVADEGMAEVGEVNADLMFAAGAGNEAEKGKMSRESRVEGRGQAHLIRIGNSSSSSFSSIVLGF